MYSNSGTGYLSGRRRGYCAAYADALEGRQWGRGGMRGSRNCFYATGLPRWARGPQEPSMFGGLGMVFSREDELAMLKGQADYLKNELDAVVARVKGLENSNKKEGK